MKSVRNRGTLLETMFSARLVIVSFYVQYVNASLKLKYICINIYVTRYLDVCCIHKKVYSLSKTKLENDPYMTKM